nr:helicase MOV-10 isoform X1 [Anolis sagrei ordinatus]
MPKATVREKVEIGKAFAQYLKDTGRETFSDREKLKIIYNQEFRNNARGPNFSSILYSLSISGNASISQKHVIFGRGNKKMTLTDQYWRPPKKVGDQPNQGPSADGGLPPRRFRVKDRAEFISKKNEIDIVSTCDVGNGKISFHVSPNKSVEIRIEVINNGTSDVTLCKYQKIPKRREFTLKASIVPPVKIPPGAKYEILVCCLTQDYGFFAFTLKFEFMTEQNERFVIGRFVSAVANTKLAEQLRPTSTYQPYQVKLYKPQFVTIEDGVPPNNFSKFDTKLITPNTYKYSPDFKDLVKYLAEGSTPSNAICDRVAQIRNDLEAPLQFDNYSSKFCLLLHLEELQMEVDIRRYDMLGVPMVADRDLLVLNAPGVAENRPSVLRGDHLLASLADEQGQLPIVQYKGYVHAVELDRLKLGFSEKLLYKFINKMKFNVTFTLNRVPLRIQHRAAELAQEKQLHYLLFPSLSYGKSLLTVNQRLNLYNPSIEKNTEQKKAVYRVVTGTSRPAPYLIFGPPGTGKTVTIVEAIKQVLHCIEGSHILACAPSNSASDLLCQLLRPHVEKRIMYRMNASSRDYGTVPEDIKPFCNWDKENKCPVFPKKEELLKYRIIITTLVTAGRLVSADFPPGHFSHVFIDESGYAVETESLIAIAGILATMDPKSNPKGGQLVLAGDPMQLGPVLRSPLAIEHGLGLSLLERLMQQNSLYQKKDGIYNAQFVTKLLRNYRSHAAILKFPNDKFYDGELQEHGDHCITHSYCKWKELVQKGFPIIFHGVCGEDQREARSPSFFNTAEVVVLINYLRKLLLEDQGKKGQSRILPKEIGVISPYRKQVEKIKYAIHLETELKNLNNIKDLKVGSVEEFQGQERRVVLISTVRSSNHYLGFDEDFKLGFLKNPKRFNVAVTRAKALLIIVGNPMTLAKDEYWAGFLRYCRENNAYRGYQYVEDENDGDGNDVLTAQLHSLSLNRDSADRILGESHIQQQVEPEWRHEH